VEKIVRLYDKQQQKDHLPSHNLKTLYIGINHCNGEWSVPLNLLASKGWYSAARGIFADFKHAKSALTTKGPDFAMVECTIPHDKVIELSTEGSVSRIQLRIQAIDPKYIKRLFTATTSFSIEYDKKGQHITFLTNLDQPGIHTIAKQ